MPWLRPPRAAQTCASRAAALLCRARPEARCEAIAAPEGGGVAESALALALGGAGDHVASLCEALRGPCALSRLCAARALASAGAWQVPGAGAAEAALASAATSDGDEDVRRAALRALGALGGGEEAIRDALREASADLRSAALEALAALDAPGGFRSLAQALEAEPVPEVRYAVTALRPVGAGDREAVARVLCERLERDPDDEVRCACAASLAAVGGGAATVSALIAAWRAGEGCRRLRARCARSLAELGAPLSDAEAAFALSRTNAKSDHIDKPEVHIAAVTMPYEHKAAAAASARGEAPGRRRGLHRMHQGHSWTRAFNCCVWGPRSDRRRCRR